MVTEARPAADQYQCADIVKMTMVLPHASLHSFLHPVRLSFITAIAAAAGVKDLKFVRLENPCGDPKKRIEVCIGAESKAEAESIMSMLTSENINAQMEKNNMKMEKEGHDLNKVPTPALILEGPAVVTEDVEMLHVLGEIKSGVRNVLTKGDAGKAGANANSFERVMEKFSDDMLKRMRQMKEKIAEMQDYNENFENRISGKIAEIQHYNENFELHMTEDMQKTLQKIEKDISETQNEIKQSIKTTQEQIEDVSKKTQEQLKECNKESSDQRQAVHESVLQKLLDLHLENQQKIVSTEKATFEYIERLQARVEKVDADSKERDERIIQLLEQISKRQGITPAAPGVHAHIRFMHASITK